MARTIDDYVALALDAFNAGFLSKAAQKRALDNVSRAFDLVTGATRDAILSEASATFTDLSTVELEQARIDWTNARGYWAMPSYPHEYRAAKHGEIFERYGNRADAERLAALRDAIKGADIAPAPVNETAKRVETVRRSIFDEMERRKAQYVEALEIGRLFGGLPVHVNAHIVHGHKGAVFLRHFFYLRGKLTPLNTIIAAAETLARERESAGE